MEDANGITTKDPKNPKIKSDYYKATIIKNSKDKEVKKVFKMFNQSIVNIIDIL